MRLSDVIFQEELFYSKIIRASEGCWEWRGSCQQRGNKRKGGGQRVGYGQFGIRYSNRNKNKGTMSAHRLMWLLVNGEVDDSMVVCHHCDNPKCVKPEHLYLASQSQNMKDCVARGRHAMTQRTHCPSGHEYTDKNTIRYTTKSGFNERKCRECHNASQRVSRSRKKELARQGSNLRQTD